jgi:hypothetical protein
MSPLAGQLTYAAISAAQVYLDFAARSKTMTLDEAKADWAKVRQRAAAVGADWDAGEG